MPKCRHCFLHTFQSRNRGSYRFKDITLAIDSTSPQKFQSRNRGSYRFKAFVIRHRVSERCCFNLVIEVLIVSRLPVELASVA